MGDTAVKPHALALATGYDDVFSQTPERALRTFRHLGYQAEFDIYVGMSHYFQLRWNEAAGRFLVDPTRPLNSATQAWFADFFQRAEALGIETIYSLSFELFHAHAPDDWMQRAHDGSPALTGWDPPSTLLPPTHAAAMAYLGDVMEAFATLQAAAGARVRAQIGEPWWWSGLGGERKPAFYDDATLALYTDETGRSVPARHADVTEIPDDDQVLFLDWLGEKLGSATAALHARVRALYPDAERLLLFFTPQVLDEDTPMLERANLPDSWGFPAFDRLQLEDYDHVTAGEWAARKRGLERTLDRLGYDRAATDYFVGFVLLPEQAEQWAPIDRAADLGLAEGYRRIFVWAHPQVARDGYVRVDMEAGDEAMQGFHDVRLPAAISFGSTGGPAFSTTVVETASGAEQRNMNWAQARAEYDLSPALAREEDVYALIAFFRARRGRAFGFRFKDWNDFRSGPPELTPTAFDQHIGAGDGVRTRFALIKSYDDGAYAHERRILKPIAGTASVAVNGMVQTDGWSLDTASGHIDFDHAPSDGAAVTAGFEFDVPVRFAEDSLAVGLESFRAGMVDSIRLIEVREETA